MTQEENDNHLEPFFPETPTAFLTELFDGIKGDAEFLARLVNVPSGASEASVRDIFLCVLESIKSTAKLGPEFLRGEISEG